MIVIATLALAAQAPDLVIRNARVVNVDEGTISAPQQLIIDEGKIVPIGVGDAVSGPDTIILDAGGRYLIPGLWDAHVHSVTNWDWHAPLFLAHGVTSVRNLHTSEPEGYALIAAIKRQGEQGEAPRMIANGFIVEGDPMWDGSTPIPDVKSMRAAVDDHIANNMDFVKVYQRTDHDVYRALLAYAAERGIPVDGHLPDDLDPFIAIRGGQRVIEHGIAMAYGCADPELLDAQHRADNPLPHRYRYGPAHDPQRCHAVASAMAEEGTVADPTVYKDAPEALDIIDDEIAMALVPHKVATQWKRMAASPMVQGALKIPSLQTIRDRQRDYVTAYLEHGVTVLAGTDVGNPLLVPGESLHRELVTLVEMGMTPQQALVAATTAPARVFEIEALGCIAAGCNADLVLLDHDPLADIANVRSIAGVVHAGTYKPKPALDAAVQEALAAANAGAE